MSVLQEEERVKGELLLLLSCSWLFFPFMLKPLWPSVVVGSFLAILVAVAYVNRRSIGLGCPSRPDIYTSDVLLYSLYLLNLAAATLISQVGYGYEVMFVVISRVVFFFLVLSLINEKTVIASLDFYTSIVMTLSILGILTIIYRYFNGTALVEANLNNLEIQVYFGAYFRENGAYICPGWFPLQGWVDEPGTWAFCIMPALLWAQLKRRNPMYVGLIGLNIVLTGSFGALLFLFLVIGFLVIVNQEDPARAHKNHVRVLLLIAVGLFFTIASGSVCHTYTSAMPLEYKPSNLSVLQEIDMNRKGLSSGTISTSAATVGGKVASLLDRMDEISNVFKYLLIHPQGAGAGLGMMTLDSSISSGFFSVFADAGVIGGFAYCFFYIKLSYFASKTLWITRKDQNKTLQVLCLSTLLLVFMGMQRGKPDASMFHAWLLALFFFKASRSVAKDSPY